MASKLISVFGATGNQGGSVLKALLNAGFNVRALTRNANSEKAQSLAKLQNVTVVEANLDDTSSVDNALKGSYGVFLVTDFSAHFEQKEVEQGRRVVDSAVRNSVSHLVFSGLDDVKSVTGKDCYHFDYKYEIEQYGFQQSNKLNFTSVRLPFYFENLPAMMFHNIGHNQYAVSLPMGNVPMYGLSVADLGECVATVFRNAETYRSKVVPIASAYLTGQEYVDGLNKNLAPLKFVYGDMPLDQYEKLPFPGALDLARMFEFYQTGKMVRDIELTKQINKNVLNFDAWLEQNKEWIVKKYLQ